MWPKILGRLSSPLIKEHPCVLGEDSSGERLIKMNILKFLLKRLDIIVTVNKEASMFFKLFRLTVLNKKNTNHDIK